eukprot:TRINITY_DN1715_c0_g4_i1.p1 TRINITY_DN1715_c0_g4~~TRINITY_DN1715_c0_g4_i1.p1  ORF type:complete len:299 (-),score=31.88 TRINITY_DN1715_c0_g4_i1:191-1087(-)
MTDERSSPSDTCIRRFRSEDPRPETSSSRSRKPSDVRQDISSRSRSPSNRKITLATQTELMVGSAVDARRRRRSTDDEPLQSEPSVKSMSSRRSTGTIEVQHQASVSPRSTRGTAMLGLDVAMSEEAQVKRAQRLSNLVTLPKEMIEGDGSLRGPIRQEKRSSGSSTGGSVAPVAKSFGAGGAASSGGGFSAAAAKLAGATGSRSRRGSGALPFEAPPRRTERGAAPAASDAQATDAGGSSSRPASARRTPTATAAASGESTPRSLRFTPGGTRSASVRGPSATGLYSPRTPRGGKQR